MEIWVYLPTFYEIVLKTFWKVQTFDAAYRQRNGDGKRAEREDTLTITPLFLWTICGRTISHIFGTDTMFARIKAVIVFSLKLKLVG